MIFNNKKKHQELIVVVNFILILLFAETETHDWNWTFACFRVLCPSNFRPNHTISKYIQTILQQLKFRCFILHCKILAISPKINKNYDLKIRVVLKRIIYLLQTQGTCASTECLKQTVIGYFFFLLFLFYYLFIYYYFYF